MDKMLTRVEANGEMVDADSLIARTKIAVPEFADLMKKFDGLDQTSQYLTAVFLKQALLAGFKIGRNLGIVEAQNKVQKAIGIYGSERF